MAKQQHNAQANEPLGKGELPICGIIMPIGGMPPDYDASHWTDVRKVIDSAIVKADMRPQIVSESFESDVIQKRIIHNLYNNPVVVCDVSGLNPNVMFELGMRLTFKKPVVIITDDIDAIPFDTNVIEHLPYPKGLHFHEINSFIDSLSSKILHLRQKYSNGTFKSFIEDFGTFQVLEPTEEVVGTDQLILEKLSALDRRVSSFYHSDGPRFSFESIASNDRVYPRYSLLRIEIPMNIEKAEEFYSEVERLFPNRISSVDMTDEGHAVVRIRFGRVNAKDRDEIERSVLTHLSIPDMTTLAWE